MLTLGDVRANVIDIRNNPPYPSSLIVDANVLCLANFPNFSALQEVDESAPYPKRVQAYQNWWGGAVRLQKLRKLTMFVAEETLHEFCQTCEGYELRQRCFDVGALTETTWSLKQARYHFRTEAEVIREQIAALLQKVLSHVSVISSYPESEHSSIFDAINSRWKKSLLDYGDAVLVAKSRACNGRIVSDDKDFATVEGITLHTACSSTIEIARQAGKLR